MSKDVKTEINIANSIDIARYYDFYRRFLKSDSERLPTFANFSGKRTYNKAKEDFDKLFSVYKQNNFDILAYIRYVLANGISLDNIANSKVVFNYAMSLKNNQNNKKIYGYFMKSVDNIVSECHRMNFNKTVDYFKYVIKSNSLANLYLSGKISGYYLANIPLLDKIVSKLDPISKASMNYLLSQQEKINNDLQIAFSQIRGVQVDAIKFTDNAIMN